MKTRNAILTIYGATIIASVLLVVWLDFPVKTPINADELISLFFIVLFGYFLDNIKSKRIKGISLSTGLVAAALVLLESPSAALVLSISAYLITILVTRKKADALNILSACHEALAFYLSGVIVFGALSGFLTHYIQIFSKTPALFGSYTVLLILILLIFEIIESFFYFVTSLLARSGYGLWEEVRDSLLSLGITVILSYFMISVYLSFRIAGLVVVAVVLLSLNYIVEMYYKGYQDKLRLVSTNKKLELVQQSVELMKGTRDIKEVYPLIIENLTSFFEFQSGAIVSQEHWSGMKLCVVTSGRVEPDESDIEDWIRTELEEGTLREMEIIGRDKAPESRLFLSSTSRFQMLVPLSTTQIALGAIILESSANVKLRKEEIRLLANIVHQLSTLIHDDLLRRELFESNRQLSRKTRQLADILEIGNRLKTNMELDELLDMIAKSIKEGLGFNSVLFSLLNEKGTHFKRVAQAGLDEVWEKVRTIEVPANEITRYFKDRFKISKSYHINHKHVVRSDYDVVLDRVQETGDDRWHKLDMLFIPMRDRKGKLIGVFSVDEPVNGKIPDVETIQALEIFANQAATAILGAQAYEYMKALGIKDGLTGLYNHRHFQEFLQKQIDDHEEDREPLGMLMIDLDDFKRINDEYGHPTGDEVLKEFADILRKNVREGDFLARYGGEEFSVIFPEIGREIAVNISERIREAIEDCEFDIKGETSKLTISLGLAFFPDDAESRESLIRRADNALYRAKESGKNKLFLAADL